MTPDRLSVGLLAVCLLAAGATAAEPPGALVIAGGGKLPAAVRDEFFKLAGGKDKANIVVIPTASGTADDPKEQDSSLKTWRDLKPASVTLLHTRDRKQADDAAFVRPLATATAVWFGGGDQNKVIEAYRGTQVEKELRQVLDRGGVLGGTSAGAAVMSDPMIQGGTTEARTGPGFGFVTGVVVDQHFVARNRVGRLRGVLDKNADLGGLGIDEATAVVVRGSTITVLGDSTVTVLPAKSLANAAERVLKSGDAIDLAAVRPAPAAKPK